MTGPSVVPTPLTPEECARLLEHGGPIGRVAMATPLGPRIVPVNYAVVEDSVVFRTAPYSELSTYGWNTEIAFEVDHLDHETQQGWSVVALGRARVVSDPEELAAIRGSWEPRPWAGGTRNLYVRLPWRELTGRRVGDHWSSLSTIAPHRKVV
jgi:nitroimidazol reductase NimA-like FMN-containing flavoprotein (pyridoxamine 5'-phosphate oxidase superfamily)